LYNITPPRPTCGLLRHRRVHPVTILTHLVMLCPATTRRHKRCSNNNRLILTLTTGETCSRRSVTNNRWRSCTHLMVTSTLQSLSPTSTLPPSAALLEGEAVNKSFIASRLATPGSSYSSLTSLIDRSSFSPAILSSYQSGPTAVSCRVSSTHHRFSFFYFYSFSPSLVSPTVISLAPLGIESS
jgi:hypothetical protein